MIGWFLAFSMLSWPSSALATPKADILCKSHKGLAGAYVEIVHKEGGGYEHSLIALPKSVIKFTVTLEATRPGPASCQIDVTKVSDGSHRYFIEQEGNSKRWKLNLPKGQNEEGEFKCAVKESLRKALCDPLGSEEPASSPVCDEANADSPGCGGGQTAN